MALSINLPLPGEEPDWHAWAERFIRILQDGLNNVPDQLVGALVIYKGSLPQGILPCDGSTFQQQVYPALFQQLGGGTLPNIASFGGFNYGIKAL